MKFPDEFNRLLRTNQDVHAKSSTIWKKNYAPSVPSEYATVAHFNTDFFFFFPSRPSPPGYCRGYFWLHARSVVQYASTHRAFRSITHGTMFDNGTSGWWPMNEGCALGAIVRISYSLSIDCRRFLGWYKISYITFVSRVDFIQRRALLLTFFSHHRDNCSFFFFFASRSIPGVRVCSSLCSWDFVSMIYVRFPHQIQQFFLRRLLKFLSGLCQRRRTPPTLQKRKSYLSYVFRSVFNMLRSIGTNSSLQIIHISRAPSASIKSPSVLTLPNSSNFSPCHCVRYFSF